MTRARVIAGAACLVLACAAAPAHAASPRLTEAAGAQFPDRELVLTLPTPKALAPRDVSVSENGAAVSRLQVLPADQSGGRRFGVVLAIDTSFSMHGRPLEAARAAARHSSRSVPLRSGRGHECSLWDYGRAAPTSAR